MRRKELPPAAFERPTSSFKRMKKPLIKPPRLAAGGVIGIVSPAGPLHGERLAMLERGIATLRRRGYVVIEGNRIRNFDGYLAGNDRERAADMNEMLRRSDIDAVFYSRGGYGSGRILSRIDYRAVRRRPKIIVGFSDALLLQAALLRRTGLVSISGLMAAYDFGNDPPAEFEEQFWQLLYGRAAGRVLSAEDAVTVTAGVAEGRLLCGTLTLFAALTGTRWMPDVSGSLLVVEDIDEPLYRIDRAFFQLEAAGALKKVNGIVFGRFISGNEEHDLDQLCVLAERYVKPLGIPCCVGFPYGHFPGRFSLPFGVRARLDADAGTLTLLEEAVL